jgi:two-component system LytT family sensor kinase
MRFCSKGSGLRYCKSKRFDDRLKVSIHQDGHIPHQAYVPTLMLITLTENAFKHGVYQSQDECWIDIFLTVHEGKLTFTVSNSIDQPSTAWRHSGSSGIGLDNIRKRLDLYFPNNHQLEISENQSCYTVSISFPIMGKP